LRLLTWFQEHTLELDRPFAADEITYTEDGVDLTLIRWMLSLTPAERLDVLQGFVDSVLEIRAWNSEVAGEKDLAALPIMRRRRCTSGPGFGQEGVTRCN
jgi:hypothetical protein